MLTIGRCRPFPIVHFVNISLVFATFLQVGFLGRISRADEPILPEALEPWRPWVQWGIKHSDCPKLWNDGSVAVCIWPGTLKLTANDSGASWSMAVRVFEKSWVSLPGSENLWPTRVSVDDLPAVVVSRDGVPAINLPAGEHTIMGEFPWQQMPQKLAIPPAVGIVSLDIAGNPVPVPKWDDNGEVWLRRSQSSPAEKDLLELNVYRKIEDGIPLWLRTEIELIVSGKSREETLGVVVPLGWKVATVNSPIPVAIEDNGQMRSQVRAGKWTVTIDAFRTDDPSEIAFGTMPSPIATEELVAFESTATFRVSQIEGLAAVDATQTTFPSKWRNLPVYRWPTDTAFRISQKMRGMGAQSPSGLNIQRRLWLDEDGQALTYEDQIRGQIQEIGRLDAAAGNDLGTVQVGGQRQLLTTNPLTGATGIEIRTRDLNMQAVGRLPRTKEMSATGWQSDADTLRMTLTLPPGWRALAIFGVDQVTGDWLTSWSLLDLFILLIFSLAVWRLFGIVAGLIALLAIGLSYHELACPRLTWLFLLMPIALLRVAGDSAGKRWLLAWKYIATAVLLFALIPFVAMQTQTVIYPQLEPTGTVYGSRSLLGWTTPYVRHSVATAESWASVPTLVEGRKVRQSGSEAKAKTSNLVYDPGARIQTGPAQPRWSWNEVYCSWNGPVTSQQSIQPVLISSQQFRMLTVLRLILLILLVAILLGVHKIRWPFSTKTVASAATLLTLACLPGVASAQFPDAGMLEQLRQRLNEVPEAFPNAAEIPTAALKIVDGNLEMRAQIHAALDVAVPLPGRFPTWSPLTVTMDGQSEVLVSRRDGYLWLLVPAGVHDVVVTGLLLDQSDWEWTFLLKPKYVSVDAPGWTVAGINRDGVPDPQVFLTREKVTSESDAAYDRTSFNAVVMVDRIIEMGLVAKVRTTVTRLSAPGVGISLKVPLIAGESVLTAERLVENGTIDVRMAATANQFSWDSTIAAGEDIRLVAAASDRLVERWRLLTSPIWNVTIDGLTPIFEPDNQDLVPVWRPWPGDAVSLAFSKPLAIDGETTTIQNVRHETTLGSRRHTGTLLLDVESSLAGDFTLKLLSAADITALTVDGQSTPVQRDGENLVIPVEARRQQIRVEWFVSETLGLRAQADALTLPAESSNIESLVVVPESRWTLWAAGPLRGPAVRFWTILAVAVLVAFILGSVPHSPLRRWEWVLLTIGLTQIHLFAAVIVVGWLFLLAWRGRNPNLFHDGWNSNIVQVLIVMMTLAALVIFVLIVAEGLLGNPRMFVVGNGSTQTYLQWFQPRSGVDLPTPMVVSVSVWFYRLLMLLWALWLSISLLRWLKWGWQQFSSGGAWRRPRKAVVDAEIL